MARPGSRALTLALALNVAPAAVVRPPVGLTGSTPGDGARLTDAPDAVQLAFDGVVRLTMLTVTDGAGRRIDTDFAISLKPSIDHRVALADVTPGDYAVAWQARTPDGWRTKGTFRFTVG